MSMETKRTRLVILIPAFWLICALVASSLVSAQEGTLEWEKITSPALAGNFLSDHLEGDELLEEVSAVYARGKVAVTWGEIKGSR
jgi:hypothetical protein